MKFDDFVKKCEFYEPSMQPDEYDICKQKKAQCIENNCPLFNLRPIRFYCKRCGKELFKNMNYSDYGDYTLSYFLSITKCSDCLLIGLQGISNEKENL